MNKIDDPNFFRGSRQYIHSTDMIAASPLSPETSEFRFIFKSEARNPGRWQKTGISKDESQRVPAKLFIVTAGERTEWEFVVDTKAVVTRRMPDFDDNLTIRDIEIEGEVLTCRLNDGYTIWQQITAATRIGGHKVFPEKQWYLVSLQGNQNVLKEFDSNTTLELRLGRQKKQLVEILFYINSQPAGRVGLFMR